MPLAQLRTHLSQQLEENPVLEAFDETQDASEERAQASSAEDASQGYDESFSELWRGADGLTANPEKELFHKEPTARPPSLHEHLLLQLRCIVDGKEEARMAEAVLGWLDTDGYLRSQIEEVASAEGIEAAEAEEALALIQRLDPPGVGARSIPECLLIQLAHRNQTNSLAARILRDHFDLLAKRKLGQLVRCLRVSLAEVQVACREIAGLDPKPARNFDTEAVPLQIPDLIVKQADGEYQVELNLEELPRLKFSSRYRRLLKDPSVSDEAKQFIRQKLRQGAWLLNAINQRQATLLAIGRAIVELQRDYFDRGIGHLKALTQEELARMVGCHPSTISRAIAGKNIETPFGILSLAAFFGGGLPSPDDSRRNLSPRTVQAEIASLIASEDPCRPLSDHVLVERLSARGFVVARRTVAKYRTALKILPTNLRKRTF